MMTPERKLVYQIFCLLETHLCDETRTSFHIDYVLTIKDGLCVDLTRETLERSMKESPATSADGILSTLNQVFDKKVGSAGIDAIADGKLNVDDLPTIQEADESHERTAPEKDKIIHRKLNDNISDDPWKLGMELFSKKDVVRVRDAAASRRQKKSQIRECIMNAINEDYKRKTSVSVGTEMQGRPCWQTRIRAGSCNLQF